MTVKLIKRILKQAKENWLIEQCDRAVSEKNDNFNTQIEKENQGNVKLQTKS